MTQPAGRALGRVHVEDPRDTAYPMTLHLATVAPPVYTSRYWYPGTLVLDQDGVGACVGFTGANWMQNSPTRTKVVNQSGFDLYNECKKIDGIPDIEGTYDRALMKVLEAQGRIVRYLWAQSGDELKQWILTTGPVLVGTNWYERMFDPEHTGAVAGFKVGDFVLKIGGNVAGGHEYLIRGYSRPRDAYKMRNSWGPHWGMAGGEAWIARADLERLVFQENGDACAAVEKVA